MASVRLMSPLSSTSAESWQTGAAVALKSQLSMKIPSVRLATPESSASPLRKLLAGSTGSSSITIVQVKSGLAERMAKRAVVDARNSLDRQVWQQAGFDFQSIGS